MDTKNTTERVAEQYLDRREVPRFEVDESAALLHIASGTRYTCRILDLSLGGCRMCLDQKQSLRESARVELTFKVNGILFRFPGVTKWTDGRSMIGIEFAAMSSRRKDELAEIISEIAAEIAANAARQAAEEKAAKEREAAEEEDRLQQEKRRLMQDLELSKEQSEKQDEQEQAEDETLRKLAEKENQRRRAEREALQLAAQFRSAAAVPLVPQRVEPEAAPASPDNSAPKERRAAVRHDVDTVAVIHLINIASKLTGRIVDLSLGGCRIRTDGRFPVGIYTRVETEFHLEGIPFRLGGVVQAIYDGNKVGVRFLDMSPRKREQLEQLIAEFGESHSS